MNSINFLSPIGYLHIAEENNFIVKIDFGKTDQGSITPLLKEAERQLTEYFKGKRKTFDLPLNPEGTEFQKKVWSALMTIPYGETKSYSDIAEIINSPKSQRAVGNANNKNPIAIVIPCHRVIGKNRNLTGYRGGLDIKEKLLRIEEITLDNHHHI